MSLISILILRDMYEFYIDMKVYNYTKVIYPSFSQPPSWSPSCHLFYILPCFDISSTLLSYFILSMVSGTSSCLSLPLTPMLCILSILNTPSTFVRYLGSVAYNFFICLSCSVHVSQPVVQALQYQYKLST